MDLIDTLIRMAIERGDVICVPKRYEADVLKRFLSSGVVPRRRRFFLWGRWLMTGFYVGDRPPFGDRPKWFVIDGDVYIFRI